MAEPIELIIDGSQVSTDWWTKEIGDLFCDLCGKKNSNECILCQNDKPWCG